MFIFENRRDLDKKSLSSVLRSVDAAQLAIALKGADEEMVDMCLATMSQRAAETIRDEMGEMTMVKRADVDDAQKSVMQIVRQMAAAGEIMIAGGSEEHTSELQSLMRISYAVYCLK